MEIQLDTTLERDMIDTNSLILLTFQEEDAAGLYEYLKEPMVTVHKCCTVALHNTPV